jgi:hypothetical protein
VGRGVELLNYLAHPLDTAALVFKLSLCARSPSFTDRLAGEA